MTPVELRADCTRCKALCCVVLPFARSADFPFAKAAGEPCRHLGADHRCTIHHRLATDGFRGCVTFDCFGAGQRASARPNPADAFPVLRVLHELLWYLYAAREWPAAAPVRADIEAAIERTGALAAIERTEARAEDAAPADVTAQRHHDAAHVAALRDTVTPLLRRASELVRGPNARDRSGADLAGRDLRRAELGRTCLRGALLIGADLRGADLHLTDLLGADLRNADLRSADVSSALYLTQAQVNAARGDRSTRLPAGLDRPTGWT